MAFDGSVKFDTKLDTSGFSNGINSMKSTASTAFKAIGAAVASGVGASIKVGMDFEAQMSKVGAISMASAEDMQVLRDKAKEMGETTVFSASQAGEAFEYMAMAGWKTEDMTAGIAGIMDLAAASGENLGTVSDIVTDALTAFGLTAQDSGHFADVLAAASSNANTNVSMMGETFKYVAPLAGSLGYSVEDTAVAIGLMANSGIKAGQAGTSLRSILTRLAKPPKEAAEAMKKLGLSITDSSGNIKPFNTLMGDMRKAFSKLDDAQKPTYAAMLGGQEAMSGLLAIVNAGEKDFDKLTEAVKNADGTAKEMSERNLDNLKGKLTLAGSAAEGLGIAVYEGIEEPLKNAVSAGTEKISELTQAIKGGELSGAVENIGTLFGNIIDTSVTLASVALPPLASVLGFVGKNFGLIAGTIIAAKGAMVAYNGVVSVSTAIETAASAVKTAHAAGVSGLNIAIGLLNGNLMSETTLTAAKTVAEGAATAGTAAHAAAQTALNTAMSANPIGLVIAGLVALTAAVGFAVASTNKETEAEKKSREAFEQSREAVDKVTESLENAKKARQESVASILSETDNTKDLADELERLTDENGKVDEANRGRAQFIIGELNDALGTEISLTDDLIVKYGNAKDKIYELIEAQEAQALASAYEEEYTNALKEKGNAIDNVSTAQTNYINSTAELEKAESELIKNSGDSAEYVKNLTQQYHDGAISSDEFKNSLYDLNLPITSLTDDVIKAKNSHDEFEKTLSDANDRLYDINYTISNYKEGMSKLKGGDVQGAIDTFDDMGNAAKRGSDKAEDAIKSLGSAYQDNLNELKSNIDVFLATGSQSAYNAVVASAKKVETAKAEYEAAGGTTAEGYGTKFIETLNGVIDINPLVDDIITNTQDMEKSATDAGYNTEQALGGNMDTLSGKILTAKASADDFSTSLNNIPKTVNVDINLNVPTIPRWSRGTRGAPEGPAVVNDGNGPELIESKDGTFRMVQSNGAALTWLSRGDKVYTAEQTRTMMKRVPHYAGGIGNGGYSGTVSITSFVEDVPEAFDRAMDELELRRDLDVIDEAQYYAELEKLRDKYFAKGSDKWWEYEKEIYEYQKELAEKAAEEARERERDEIDRKHDAGLLSEQAYIAQLTAFRDKYYKEGTEEFIEMTDKISDISRQSERDMLDYSLSIGLISKRQYYDKLSML